MAASQLQSPGCYSRTCDKPMPASRSAPRRASSSRAIPTRSVRLMLRFVPTARAEAIGRTEKYWPAAPDFAAEVISPGDTVGRVEAKALGWLPAGTSVVLVLHPVRHTATAYRRPGAVRVHRGDEVLDLSDAVPGWRVALADFFR